ncbi:acyltransferase family protein [Nocardioides houyundeii]|uniref:acyltransferase family protein n=1 Tax=Nocardioides houyundeii TaxID=2045452 RepID=UPI000DF2136B|nr:acyltransferase [Nocardioides houyundeii]
MSARSETDAAVRSPRGGKVVLGDRLGSRENNFDLLRLLAAWAVLVSHSFSLVGHDEPLHQLGTTLGNLGVLIFFAVSGLLIRRSWEYDPSPWDFWVKRALRLLPALATVGLLTAFVLGPLVTSWSLSSYLASAQTWLYPLRITLLFPFGAQLPGVFEDNLYAGAVNGPLWSLPLEVFAYLLLFLLGLAGLLARRSVVTVMALAGLAWAAWWITWTSDAVGSGYVLAAFALGAAAYSWRDRLVLSWPWAATAFVACVLSGLGPDAVRVVVWTVAVTYLAYWFAYAVPRTARWMTAWGDASYGVYIWAFPIQQTFVQLLGPDTAPWVLILVCTPVVWLLAIASWRLVERPALRHKPARTGTAHGAGGGTP